MSCQVTKKHIDSPPATHPIINLYSNSLLWPSVQHRVTGICNRNNKNRLKVSKHHLILRCIETDPLPRLSSKNNGKTGKIIIFYIIYHFFLSYPCSFSFVWHEWMCVRWTYYPRTLFHQRRKVTVPRCLSSCTAWNLNISTLYSHIVTLPSWQESSPIQRRR